MNDISHRSISLGWLWWGLSAIYLTLIVHFAVYRFVQGQCTSSSCMVLALGQVIIGAGVFAVAVGFNQPIFETIRRHLATIPPSAYLLVVCIGLFVFGLGLRPEWVYAHMSLASSGLAAVLYLTIYNRRLPRVPSLVLVAGIGLLIGAVILIRVMALAGHPSIHILDEPQTLSWGVSYLRTGQPSDWIMGGVSGTPYPLPRYYSLVAAWLRLVGVGLWEARLFSLLVTAVMIALTTFAARNLFNRQTALITLLALLASSVVSLGLRLRHDVGVGLTIAASLWAYSVARKRGSWRLHSLAGVLVGIGVSAHYHAIGLSAALIAGLYLPDYIVRVRQKKIIPQPEAISYFCGALASGLAIMGLQVLPDLYQFQLYLAPRSPRSVNEFLESFVYHIAQIPEHSKQEFLLIIAAAGAALLRRTRLDLALALSLALGYLALAVMASKYYGPFDYYSVPLMPIVGLLIGRFWGGFGSESPSMRQSVAVVGSLCFLFPQLGYTLHAPIDYLRAGAPLRPTPAPAAQWVLDNVPRDETIVGEHLYFLWLHEYPFLSPHTPSYFPPERKAQFGGLDTEEERLLAWTELAPDVIIIDSTLATAGMLNELLDSGYLDEQGFEIAFGEENGVVVYQRK